MNRARVRTRARRGRRCVSRARRPHRSSAGSKCVIQVPALAANPRWDMTARASA